MTRRRPKIWNLPSDRIDSFTLSPYYLPRTDSITLSVVGGAGDELITMPSRGGFRSCPSLGTGETHCRSRPTCKYEVRQANGPPGALPIYHEGGSSPRRSVGEEPCPHSGPLTTPGTSTWALGLTPRHPTGKRLSGLLKRQGRATALCPSRYVVFAKTPRGNSAKLLLSFSFVCSRRVPHGPIRQDIVFGSLEMLGWGTFRTKLRIF